MSVISCAIGLGLVLGGALGNLVDRLLRAPGHVLTRTLIADQVWNYEVYNQSNVVDVYIRNLRRKIDDPCAVKLIHTVRGLGYVLR